MIQRGGLKIHAVRAEKAQGARRQEARGGQRPAARGQGTGQWRQGRRGGRAWCRELSRVPGKPCAAPSSATRAVAAAWSCAARSRAFTARYECVCVEGAPLLHLCCTFGDPRYRAMGPHRSSYARRCGARRRPSSSASSLPAGLGQGDPSSRGPRPWARPSSRPASSSTSSPRSPALSSSWGCTRCVKRGCMWVQSICWCSNRQPRSGTYLYASNWHGLAQC